MTSVSDLRTREAKKRKTKRESKKVHFPTCIFFFVVFVFFFFPIRLSNLDTYIQKISTKRRESARGRGQKESKARGPAKREQQATTIPASGSSDDQPFQPVKKELTPTSMSRKYKRNINYNKKYCSSLDDRR